MSLIYYLLAAFLLSKAIAFGYYVEGMRFAIYSSPNPAPASPSILVCLGYFLLQRYEFIYFIVINRDFSNGN